MTDNDIDRDEDEREDFEPEEEERDGDVLPAEALRSLSPLAWQRYGARSIAYLRPVMVDGMAAVAIHAADGTPIGAAATFAIAVAAIRQHGMGAVLVH